MNTEQNRKETDGKIPRFLKGIYRRTREGVEVLIVEKQNKTDKQVEKSNITQSAYSFHKGKGQMKN